MKVYPSTPGLDVSKNFRGNHLGFRIWEGEFRRGGADRTAEPLDFQDIFQSEIYGESYHDIGFEKSNRRIVGAYHCGEDARRGAKLGSLQQKIRIALSRCQWRPLVAKGRSPLLRVRLVQPEFITNPAKRVVTLA
eukprot:8261132-Pyramimonas_sp.AAC.3